MKEELKYDGNYHCAKCEMINNKIEQVARLLYKKHWGGSLSVWTFERAEKYMLDTERETFMQEATEINALYPPEPQVVCPTSPQPLIQHAANCKAYYCGENGPYPCNCGAVSLPPDELLTALQITNLVNGYNSVDHSPCGVSVFEYIANAQLAKCHQSEAAKIKELETENEELMEINNSYTDEIKGLIREIHVLKSDIDALGDCHQSEAARIKELNNLEIGVKPQEPQNCHMYPYCNGCLLSPKTCGNIPLSQSELLTEISSNDFEELFEIVFKIVGRQTIYSDKCRQAVKDILLKCHQSEAAEIAELTRKGESLCCQNGNLLLEKHDLEARIKKLESQLESCVNTLKEQDNQLEKILDAEAVIRADQNKKIIDELQLLLSKSDAQYDEINFRESKDYDMAKVGMYHEIKTKVIKNLIAKLQKGESPK